MPNLSLNSSCSQFDGWRDYEELSKLQNSTLVSFSSCRDTPILCPRVRLDLDIEFGMGWTLVWKVELRDSLGTSGF